MKSKPMQYDEYMAKRETVLEIMWRRNVFPEQRADEIMKLFGVDCEDKKGNEGTDAN